VGINFSFPLFLRKERGSLQLAKFKIQDTQLTLNFERLQLKNKINAQQTELESITKQRKIISELVKDNSQMLQSEERLFSMGESSIFLLNSRENNLVSIQLTQLVLENRFLNSNAELFKIMANPD
jgi:outer membrane protein TolC